MGMNPTSVIGDGGHSFKPIVMEDSITDFMTSGKNQPQS